MLLGSDLYPGCRMQTRASLALSPLTASGRVRHIVVLWASGALMGGRSEVELEMNEAACD